MSKEKEGEIELDEFISATINQINRGIIGAIEKFQSYDSHAKVNPYPPGIEDWSPYCRDLEFELSVSATKSKTGGGGIKLAVFRQGVEGKSERTSDRSSVNKVKFSIPVVFAGQPIERRKS